MTAAPPDTSIFTYDMELLSYTAHMWRISKSEFPPSLAEVLMRDKDWDNQVSAMFKLQQYFIDTGVRIKASENAVQGIRGYQNGVTKDDK